MRETEFLPAVPESERMHKVAFKVCFRGGFRTIDSLEEDGRQRHVGTINLGHTELTKKMLDKKDRL